MRMVVSGMEAHLALLLIKNLIDPSSARAQSVIAA